jgi:hypothetical protein
MSTLYPDSMSEGRRAGGNLKWLLEVLNPEQEPRSGTSGSTYGDNCDVDVGVAVFGHRVVRD